MHKNDDNKDDKASIILRPENLLLLLPSPINYVGSGLVPAASTTRLLNST